MSDAMIHPTAEKLQGFVEGLLDEADRVVLASHLVDCAECQTEVEEWRALFAMISTLPQHVPAKGFANRVMAHVTLPDPWYVRIAARAGAQLQVFTPKTTRGWAAASACMALPLLFFGALTAWLLSKPYVTPNGLLAFTIDRAQAGLASLAQGTFVSLLQSDFALFIARALETMTNAGLGATGALAAAVAMATALSAWVLYQNLFRTTTTRENHTYASYSF
jgi:anti-sigma factor RsiW